MARTAKTGQINDLKIRAYVDGPVTTKALHDGGGLYLRRRVGGAYWYLRLTDPATGAEQWHRMFPDDPKPGYPDKLLKAARTEAARLWRERSAGSDPRAARLKRIADDKAAQDAAKLAQQRRQTVEQVFARWRDSDLQPHTSADGTRRGRKDGGRYVEEQFTRHVFPSIGGVAIADVTRADVLAILDAVKATGRLRTANVLLSNLKQMFAFAAERELVAFSVIAAVSKRKVGGVDTARDRVLTVAELKTLRDLLPNAGLTRQTQLAIWLTLATGVRVGELMGGVWADCKPQAQTLQRVVDARNEAAKSGGIQLGFVDLEAGVHYLPTTKNQRDHTIHLSEFAAGLFAELLTFRPLDRDGKPAPWVFPNTGARTVKKSKRETEPPPPGPVCVKSFGKQLADRQREPERKMQHRALNTSSLSLAGGRWTAHDLRRTAATLMAQMGISNDVIDECLNHRIAGRTTRVYVHDRRGADQAKAFDALGARLAALMGGTEEASNVVALRAA